MTSGLNVIKLVNLDTAEVIEADPYVLREQCIPEGYKIADDITVDEWIEALKKARGLQQPANR